MFRDFANENIARDDLNVIIVTHGLTLRLVSEISHGTRKDQILEGVDRDKQREQLSPCVGKNDRQGQWSLIQASERHELLQERAFRRATCDGACCSRASSTPAPPP